MRRRRRFRVKCEKCRHEFQSTKNPSLFSVQCGACGSRKTSRTGKASVEPAEEAPSAAEREETISEQDDHLTLNLPETMDPWPTPGPNLIAILNWLRIPPRAAWSNYDTWYRNSWAHGPQGLYTLFRRQLHFDDLLARICTDSVFDRGPSPWIVVNSILSQMPPDRRYRQAAFWRRLGVPV